MKADGNLLVTTISYIRSSLERLHVDAPRTISSGTVIDEWDPSITFLKNNKFLTAQQDKMARGLFALLSDEGVQPVMAKREFCRVAGNMAIEYGLMFLTVLAKKGVQISLDKKTTGTCSGSPGR